MKKTVVCTVLLWSSLYSGFEDIGSSHIFLAGSALSCVRMVRARGKREQSECELTALLLAAASFVSYFSRKNTTLDYRQLKIPRAAQFKASLCKAGALVTALVLGSNKTPLPYACALALLWCEYNGLSKCSFQESQNFSKKQRKIFALASSLTLFVMQKTGASVMAKRLGVTECGVRGSLLVMSLYAIADVLAEWP